MAKPKFKAIDFFCGAGGVTCGFIEAGINVLGGIDNDISCKKTYEDNNDTRFLLADIEKLHASKLKLEFGINKNDDNLIFVGCSPCQYYTNLNTDKSKSEKSKMLLEEFQRFVSYFRPGFIFVENVPGLEKNNGGPLQTFKNKLLKLGYEFDDSILNTKYYGIPQNRRRYILLASRTNRNIKLPKKEKNDMVTIAEIIGDTNIFPKISAGHKDDSTFIHSASNLSELNLQRIKSTPKNGGSRKAWASNKNLQLNCYKNHNGHQDVYGRMKWNAVSPTITTKFISLSNGRYGHPSQNRAISLREGASLQSFPLKYIFHSNTQGTIASMIGNAVPPKFAKIIGKTIIESN